MAFKQSSIDIFKAIHALKSFTAKQLEEATGAPEGSCSAACSQLFARGILHKMERMPFDIIAKNGRPMRVYRTVYRLVDTIREMSVEKAVELLCSNEKLEFDKRFEKRGGH